MIIFSILEFFIFTTLAATSASHPNVPKNQGTEPINTKSYALTSQPKIADSNNISLLSEEQKIRNDIMQLAGGYFELCDQKNQIDAMEQLSLIESIRTEIASQKKEKRLPAFTSKTLESQRFFGNSHIEAAFSIKRVHSKYFTSTIPDAEFIGWGGKFMDKINRIEMVYSIEKMPIVTELYALLLSGFLEDINLHEDRFGPYLATFPVSTEEYELRLMLADYRTLSTKEAPKPAFIFNIGETIFSCYRESESKCLKVFRKEHFSEIIEQAIKNFNQEKEERKLKKASSE